MKIYIAQHGLAMEEVVDPARPLSDWGRDEVKRVATRLSEAGIEIKGVYHSGKLRALQTAELFASQLGVAEPAAMDGLKPNDDPEILISALDGDCLYVGHLPHLQRVVTTLITGNAETGLVNFSNAGVLCIDIDDSGVRIDWYITPRLC